MEVADGLPRLAWDLPMRPSCQKILVISDKMRVLFGETETFGSAVKRFSACLQKGNLDALILFGFLTAYFIGDWETAARLFCRAMNAGDPRAKYEVGLMLMHGPSKVHVRLGRRFLDDAARSGHMLSQCMRRMNEEIYMGSLAKLSAFYCVLPMMSRKVSISDRRTKQTYCSNQFCLRMVFLRRSRYFNRRLESWGERQFLRDCGASWEVDDWAQQEFGHGVDAVMDFRPNVLLCRNCEQVTYCGRSCQRHHWEQHKHICMQEID